MIEKNRQRFYEWRDESRYDPRLLLPFEVAVAVCAAHHAQINLYWRVATLYAFLIGKTESPAPDPHTLSPVSPFGGEMDEEIMKENATREDVRHWIELPDFWKL